MQDNIGECFLRFYSLSFMILDHYKIGMSTLSSYTSNNTYPIWRSHSSISSVPHPCFLVRENIGVERRVPCRVRKEVFSFWLSRPNPFAFVFHSLEFNENTIRTIIGTKPWNMLHRAINKRSSVLLVAMSTLQIASVIWAVTFSRPGRATCR